MDKYKYKVEYPNGITREMKLPGRPYGLKVDGMRPISISIWGPMNQDIITACALSVHPMNGEIHFHAKNV